MFPRGRADGPRPPRLARRDAWGGAKFPARERTARPRHARPRHAHSLRPEPRHAPASYTSPPRTFSPPRAPPPLRPSTRAAGPFPPHFLAPLAPTSRGRRCDRRGSAASSSSTSSRLLPLLLLHLLLLTTVPTPGRGRARPVYWNRSEMATCAVEVFGLPEDEVRGPRGCGAGFPSRCSSAGRRKRRLPKGRLSAPTTAARAPGARKAPRGPGAVRRARGCGCGCGGGACFSERHFLRQRVDSTLLSSRSRRLPCQFPSGSAEEGH